MSRRLELLTNLRNAMTVRPSVSLANGRFQLRRRLGNGVFGGVYEAVDLLERQIVAMKVFGEVHPLHRFQHEFLRAAELKHPNVVRLLEPFHDGLRCYFTMEFVEGLPLVDYVRGLHPRERRALTVDEYARTRDVLGQVIAGVTALHAAGMLHGDLKPANVLVSDEGRVSIVDISFARHIKTPSSPHPKGPGGTPLYMAPELLLDTALNEATDWYSVGVMLYELLTAQLPFAGSWPEVLAAKADNDVRPPDDVDREEPLSALCLDLLRRDPHARPTGAEIRERFSRFKRAGP